jgi:integral membrane sensor domain MASE1
MSKIFSDFKGKLTITFIILCAFFIPLVITVVCLLSFNIMIEQNISKNWETLVAGVMAIIAAIITVKKIEQQIAESRRQAESQRKQNLIAAKIKMSGALMEIQEYSKDAFAYCMACVFEVESKKINEYKGKLLPHFND